MITPSGAPLPKRTIVIISIGLFLSIATIVFVTVAAVHFAPRAFSSLASLSASVSQYRDSLGQNVDGPIEITTDSLQAPLGELVTISWQKDNRPGTYSFSYTCTDGVSVDIVDRAGLRRISCNEVYTIGDSSSLSLITEAVSDTEIQYTISFSRENDTEPIRTGTAIILAQADTTQNSGLVLGEQDSSDWRDEIVGQPAPEASQPATSTPTYVLTWPSSNPTGSIDLTPKFIASGSIVNNVFRPGSIIRGQDGAIQFEVQNIGTKTSNPFTYAVSLPDGTEYVSPMQKALLPTERVLISIGFPASIDSSHTFSVVLADAGDVSNSNNTFTRTIQFTR